MKTYTEEEIFKALNLAKSWEQPENVVVNAFLEALNIQNHTKLPMSSNKDIPESSQVGEEWRNLTSESRGEHSVSRSSLSHESEVKVSPIGSNIQSPKDAVPSSEICECGHPRECPLCFANGHDFMSGRCLYSCGCLKFTPRKETKEDER